MSFGRNKAPKEENIRVLSAKGRVLLQRGVKANELDPRTARMLAAALITAAEMADKGVDWE